MTKQTVILYKPSLKVTYICIFIIIFIWCIMQTQQQTYNYKQMEIIDDLPLKTDLDKYLSVLEKIVYFVEGHRYYVDIDLCFGIYLINVNLRNIVEMRGHFLPFQKQVRMLHLVNTNDDIVLYYSKSHNYNSSIINRNVLVNLLNLYYNRSVIWPNLIPRFNIDLLLNTKFYSRKNLEVAYFKWPKYKKIVFDYIKGNPTPNESDHCLNLLAQNPITYNSDYFHCQVPYSCLKMMVKGSDYGYGIAHRLLFLLAARYWRSCVIMSLQEDKQAMDNMCAKMYNEVEYIANHDFGLPDLFMEHATLCSIEGHAQFLRRSWIDELLDFQTGDGCFNLTRPSEGTSVPPETTASQNKKNNQTDWNDKCNAHVTGVAGAMLSSAIRLIMENYF